MTCMTTCHWPCQWIAGDQTGQYCPRDGLPRPVNRSLSTAKPLITAICFGQFVYVRPERELVVVMWGATPKSLDRSLVVYDFLDALGEAVP